MENMKEDPGAFLDNLQKGDEGAFRVLFDEFYTALCLFAERFLGEREAALDEIRKLEGVTITGALHNNIEVNAAGVDKGNALLWLAQYLGIAPEETMAFGDGNNDITLLEKAGTGVAMKNGIEEVKHAADRITEKTNDEEGAAKFIETYVLKKGE